MLQKNDWIKTRMVEVTKRCYDKYKTGADV